MAQMGDRYNLRFCRKNNDLKVVYITKTVSLGQLLKCLCHVAICAVTSYSVEQAANTHTLHKILIVVQTIM
jgi:hypothetical protein